MNRRNPMKVKLFFVALLLGVILASAGFAQQNLSSSETAQRSGYHISESGPNHSRWLKARATTNAGTISFQTNSFVVLSAGLNRPAGNRWAPAQPELIITHNLIIGR